MIPQQIDGNRLFYNDQYARSMSSSALSAIMPASSESINLSFYGNSYANEFALFQQQQHVLNKFQKENYK